MKINKLILMAALAIMFAGCDSDRLEVTPTGDISQNLADENEEALIGVKNGMYLYLEDYRCLGRDVIAGTDVMSDLSFVSSTNSGRFIFLNGLTHSAVNVDISPLGWFYSAIVQANTVINTSLPETDRVKQAKAEALVGRALSYFYLVNLYSAAVTSGINQEYGVPLNLANYNPTAKRPRASVAEVYAQIEADLLEALNLFDPDGNYSDKSLFSPLAAELLLSRVYLFEGKWQDAYDYAVKVDEAGSGNYQDAAGYVSYFSADQAPETVFELDFSSAASLGTNSLANVLASTGGYNQNLFRADFVNSFDASDVRKTLYITDPRPNHGNDNPAGYFTTKYATNFQGVKILRMSEAKLNKIEAMYHLGNTAGALTELNAFVQTRGSYSYSDTGAKVLDDILSERAKEFAGEGYRFFDLKRNQLPIVKNTNCIDNCNVDPKDSKKGYLFVFPIPQGEMDNNPQMTQYPGW